MNLFDMVEENNKKEDKKPKKQQKEEVLEGKYIRYLCLKCGKRFPPEVAEHHDMRCGCCGGKFKKCEYTW